jgi:hypothetical protein
MKWKISWNAVSVAVSGFLMLCMLSCKASSTEEISLTVLNPRGEITPPPIVAPAGRVADLSGRKIAIYWNGKAGGDNLWNNVEALLKEKIKNPNILRYEGPFDLGDALAAKIAHEVDAFIYGVGD